MTAGPRRARRAGVVLSVLLVAVLAVAGAAGAVTAAGAGTGAADGGGVGPAAAGGADAAVDGGGAGAASVGATPLTAAPAGAAAPADASALDGAQEVDADSTRITIDVRPDGDAEWTVELRVALEENGSREAFESLQADVEADAENVTASFRDRMQGTADVASDATGREMIVENVTVDAYVDELANDGVLVYTFRWTNFAVVDGERLRAGDAIDGFFLESGTRLTIRWPEGYAASSIEPAPDDRTSRRATWRGGETDFVAGEPRVVASPEGGGTAWLAGAAVLGALVLLGGAWVLLRDRVALGGAGRGEGAGAASADAGAGGAGAGAGSAGAGAGGAGSAGAGGGGAGAGGAGASGAGAGATGGGGAPDVGADGTAAGASAAAASDDGAADAGDDAGADPGDGSSGPGDDVPPELLSNEEQVLRLLEEHGGRMKQQQVVQELGWTEAKTSQVVTSMHDDDAIEKFRIGRENVLALPGEADL